MSKINSVLNDSPTILEQIQLNANYKFRDAELLNKSVTHPSYAAEHNMPLHDYQRLEFLGDAVLQIIVSDYLYRSLPNEQEGVLTRLRSLLTNEKATADYSLRIGLDVALLLGRGECLGGGRTRSSILGDIFEAFLAAIYLDGGIEPATALVMRLLPPLETCMAKLDSDENPKGTLQMYCQAHFKANAVYEIVSETGPKHAPYYVVNAVLKGKVIGTGEGHSHKEADKNAAHDALVKFGQIASDKSAEVAPNFSSAPQQAYAGEAITPPEDSPATELKFGVTAPPEANTTSTQSVSSSNDFKHVTRPVKTVRRILALDFDGVICDSATETAATAWRAAHGLWPDVFDEPNIPQPFIDKFRAARPYLETGFQSIIMIRLIKEGHAADYFKTDFAAKLQAVMDENKLTKDALVKAFGNTRDQWISSDLDGWLALHGLYPGTIDALKTALTKHKVLILTTKQERFVSAILKQQGVDFPEMSIFGLDRKISKETELAALVGAKKTNIHFVEDRIETLLRIKANPTLKRVKLHYAPWGYGTPEQLEQAKADSRIDILTLESFAELLG